MVVGMAVDYAVHFTHFYNEATGNRFEKAQGALHGVGISVVGGAVTTAGAALPLIFAPNFQFFHQANSLILHSPLHAHVHVHVHVHAHVRRCSPICVYLCIRGISMMHG